MNTFSIRSFVATVVLAATSFTVAQAQNNKMSATVPFAFEYAGHSYDAGQYSFTASGNVVELNGGSQIQEAVAHRASMDKGIETKIVFHRAGGQYYLRQIVMAKSSQSLTFLESRHEKGARTLKVAGLSTPAVTDVVVAAQ